MSERKPIRASMMLSAIELDTSIQCRAHIDTERVDEYAAAMAAGEAFPAIDVYGTASKCWIGDGWHRVLAAQQIGSSMIEVVFHRGGRIDALKHALGANAVHGMRRTNADKRRCVEIALREFPKLSSRAVAELCGVGHTFVDEIRPKQVASDATSRTGSDGKQYPATRRREEPEPEPEEDEGEIPPGGPIGPPCCGLQFARLAIMRLGEIPPNDAERQEAFAMVRRWLDDQETR